MVCVDAVMGTMTWEVSTLGEED